MDIFQKPRILGLPPRSGTEQGSQINNELEKESKKNYIQQETAQQQTERLANAKSLLSKKRTVAVFSKFCSTFYPKEESRRCQSSNDAYYPCFVDEVTHFCHWIRLCSHYSEYISHFDEITDTVSVDSSSESEARSTLRKLIHQEIYNEIPDIKVARDTLPLSARGTHKGISGRRSARLLPLPAPEGSSSANQPPSSDNLESEISSAQEDQCPPVKRQKTSNTRFNAKSEQAEEIISAIEDVIEVCLKDSTADEINKVMQTIVNRTDHWKDLSVLKTSMIRWFFNLELKITVGFTQDEIQRARNVFSERIGLSKCPTGQSKASKNKLPDST